jgi:thiamine-monophosphate kinase
MTLSELGEDALVARLTRRLPRGRRVVVGPGDDCAVLRARGTRSYTLLKTDCLVEGIHFLREHRGEKVGWKALCRAISDIAAMGGEPESAVVTVAAPPEVEVEFLERLYRGLSRAARRYGVSIVGGETSRSLSGIFVSVALTGSVKRKRLVLRSGGRVGDVLFVTGRLGGSQAGWHLTFTPRLAEARWLVKQARIHAMMDLSDGLAADLPRLADASRVGYDINRTAIPRRRGCSLEQALGEGEDYELLFTVSADEAERIRARWAARFPKLPLTAIGVLTSDRGKRSGLGAGYVHFSGCQNSP